MAKISKKQRSALKAIDRLSKERRRNQIIGFAAIGVMAVLIAVYNALVYQLGIVEESNTLLRALLYIAAMVAAGVSGINLMRSSRKGREIDGYRQSNSISRDTLDAWKKGEID